MLNNPPTPDEFEQQMQHINAVFSGDAEMKHIAADAYLCETLERLGYSEGIKVFYDMQRWYA